MKKLTVILLTSAMLLSLAACSNHAADGQPAGTTTHPMQPTGSEDTTSTADTAVNPGQTETVFGLTFANVKLVPGAAFDATALPEAASVMEVPSCAFEGTDNAYNYEAFELTAYDEGAGEIIYSIYLLDPNTSTDEGLYLGDSLERAKELYGTDYAEDGTQITFTRGETTLNLILQDTTITSIEYRLCQ